MNATVTETAIEEFSVRRGVEYEVTVGFTYEYDGTTYESERLYPTTLSPTFETESDARSVLVPYEQNETVTAYVEPSDPGGAFLERQRTDGPLWLAGGGGLVLLLTVLDAAGAQTPGQNINLRPASETRTDRLFGLDRGTVRRLGTRAVGGAGLVVVSLLATVFVLVSTEASSIRAEVTDPAGVALLGIFVGVVTVIGGLFLYGSWSFAEYRQLRERIPNPRPLSPFVRPTRLVTMLKTSDDDLGEYGRRVKRTGFAFAVALFFCGVVLRVGF